MNLLHGSAIALCLIAATHSARAGPITLGSAASFGVLAGSTLTNSGATTIAGNVGVSPGTAITGFPPGLVTSGTIDDGNQAAARAEADLTTAYSEAAAQTGGTTLTGQNLGGLTLTPGTYSFASSAQLTGTLTLNAQGRTGAVFLIQVGSMLTTGTDATVDLINGGDDDSIFWQIGSSATLGAGTDFVGTLMALSSITLESGASISCGAALARNGAVTLQSNAITTCASTPIAEPRSALLLLTALLTLMLAGRTPPAFRTPLPSRRRARHIS